MDESIAPAANPPESAGRFDLAGAAVGDAPWQRVSPRYLWVDLVGSILVWALAAGLLTIAPATSGLVWLWALPVVCAVVGILVVAFTPRRVRAIGYRMRDDDLLFRRGIMVSRVVAVPYGRMQLVDINRGPVARAFGLAELKLVTAAAATGVTIPGLADADAEALRDRLVELAESRRAGL